MVSTHRAATFTSTLLVLLVLLGPGSAIYISSGIQRHSKHDSGLSFRISSGRNTQIERHPYQLALEGGGRMHLCGGSILSEDWALTAAHCVYNQPVKWLSFRSGSTLRERGGTVHEVKYYIYHELFRKNTLDYDVAVVRVKTPFLYTLTSLPVNLPMDGPKEGDKVTATGWGYLQQEQLAKPRLLQEAQLVVIDWNKCSELYKNQITERMMCVGDPRFKQDICSGDSGGPLILGRRRVQVGIVSWAYKCADNLPSVYVNVSTVASWIREKAGLEEPLIFKY